MDIISMIKCMCKYKIKGIYNDLSMHLINLCNFEYPAWTHLYQIGTLYFLYVLDL